ncbi:MAG: DUF4214 domain-containing protein [Patescibacteria group bacterium]
MREVSMKKMGTALAFALLCLPTFSHAATLAELQTQVQALMARLTALQAQTTTSAAPPGGGAAPCPTLVRNLSRGMRGSDVTQLQQFLISQNLLASDSATGFFGAMTEIAVKQWQSKNSIASAGTSATTGYGAVGPKTRAVIKAGCAAPSVRMPANTARDGNSAICEEYLLLKSQNNIALFMARHLDYDLFINGDICMSTFLHTNSPGVPNAPNVPTTPVSCTPLTQQTQIVSCPAGQTGSITQTRTSLCATGASTPMWGAWTTTANTCVITRTNTITCGADVVNNPSVDAASSLQACIAQAANTIELVPGRYYIASTLDIGNRSNVTIQTKGVSAGSACLQAGAAACAIITASSQNAGPVLFKSTGASNLTLSYIALDGNNALRRATLNNPTWIGGSAYNAKVHGCTDCRFNGFASVRAPQGTGMEFEGDRAVFENSLFRDNGWGQLMYPAGSAWADGLTIWSSDDIVIRNSEFSNNSDINLILGDAPRAVIENNVIKNTYNFAFGAFMLDNYNGTQAGRFDGAIIRNNNIDCGYAMCGIGINVGGKLWYPAPLISGGTITNNTVTGAKQGILINGASGVTVINNQIVATGTYVKNNCSTNAIGLTSGESASISGNNVAVGLNLLAGCGPAILPDLLLQQTGTDPQITKLYQDILGRDPDMTGGNAFSYALQNSMTLAEIRSEIAHSPEARSIINALYQGILRRTGDASGLDNWVSTLASGQLTIDQIRVSFLTSAEGQGHTYDQ